ncbi:MAG TPA: hypothetical protein VEQ59_19465 [Polyangiaceae bacterium]|nr:hypothetical protein [Polyangiaceae bacterium]
MPAVAFVPAVDDAPPPATDEELPPAGPPPLAGVSPAPELQAAMNAAQPAAVASPSPGTYDGSRR